MRISDWSSYVCSSDLTEIEVEIGREALPLDVIVAIVDLFGKDQAVVVAPSVRLDIIGLELALIIGDAARHAEAVRQALREVDAALGGQLFRIVVRSEEHTSELPSLMRNSYAVFCLQKKTNYHRIIQSKTYQVDTIYSIQKLITNNKKQPQLI